MLPRGMVSGASEPEPARRDADAASPGSVDHSAGETGWRGALRSPHAWVASTNFAEGFPYAIVHNLSDAIFIAMGANLKALGLTSLFHLPWNLKFAWGPLLDRFGTKRTWMLAMELLLVAILLGVASLVQSGAALAALSVLFVAMGFVAATHDIAIDAYYLAALDDEGQSSFVGYRAAAFRVATLVVSGPLIAFGARVGWTWAVLACVGILGLLMAYHWRWLPKVEVAPRPLRQVVFVFLRLRVLALGVVLAAAVFFLRDHVTVSDVVKWSAVGLTLLLVGALASLPTLKRRLAGSDAPFAIAFLSFLEQRRIAVILGFTLTFRLGESFLQKMKMPFVIEQIGRGKDAGMEVYSWANGTVGVIALFVATIIGGKLIARGGLRRWIWPFVIAQNVLNLLYAGWAWIGSSSLWVVYGVIAIERAGEGLGTAVLLVFLMRTCSLEHKAAHYALISALMSVGFTLAGTVSGFLATELGFANYFAFTFVATLPGMLFIFWLPYLDGRDRSAERT